MANVVKTDGIRLTKKGLELLSKLQTGKTMNFSGAIIGDGILTDSDDTSTFTTLKNVVPSHKTGQSGTSATVDISKVKIEDDGTVSLGIKIKNGDRAFYLREVGITATDPDVGEILYAYVNFGDEASVMPSADGDTYIVRNIYLSFAVSDTADVTANVSLPAEVTFEEFEAYKAEVAGNFTTYRQEASDGLSALSDEVDELKNEYAIYVKCNGSDDTPALQAAINSAPRGAVIYPVGEECRICYNEDVYTSNSNAVLSLRSYITLDGSYCRMINVYVEHDTIQRLFFLGGTTIQNTYIKFTKVEGLEENGTVFFGQGNAIIRNNRIICDGMSKVYSFMYITNIDVINNYFSGINAERLEAGISNTFTGNTLCSCNISHVSFYGLIANNTFRKLTLCGDFASLYFDGSTIGNFFDGIKTEACTSSIVVFSLGGDDTVFAYNVIKKFTYDYTNDKYLFRTSSATIQNNYIYANCDNSQCCLAKTENGNVIGNVTDLTNIGTVGGACENNVLGIGSE